MKAPIPMLSAVAIVSLVLAGCPGDDSGPPNRLPDAVADGDLAADGASPDAPTVADPGGGTADDGEDPADPGADPSEEVDDPGPDAPDPVDDGQAGDDDAAELPDVDEEGDGDAAGPDDATGEVDEEPDGGGPVTGWTVAYAEDFEGTGFPTDLAWSPDPVPDDGPFSDEGSYFTEQGVTAPEAYRITESFGDGQWLTVESYTRTSSTPFASLASVVDDPAGGDNRVLRVASPDHTDATVVRPSEALPARYRVSLRVGFASFGDGYPGTNGYDGGESAEPWGIPDATGENGFYWLAILDDTPRPHNNTWIHHHRKVVIDSDNNQEAWTQIWTGDEFIDSGHHPVMMFALDGAAETDPQIGKPFIPWAAGQWQPSGTIRAADAYRDETWYDVMIERTDGRFTLQVSGDFLHGGEQTYTATLDYAEACVWHYNRPGEEAAADCIDESSLPAVPGHPLWPADGAWPDWFMVGDPHANYYEGEVYYDDVTLEVWSD